MSLYNSLFGWHPMSEVFLRALDINVDDIPRYRDCFYDEEREQIVIHTRTGGGNRPWYDNEESHKKEHETYYPGDEFQVNRTYNDGLRKHPCYINDEDDDYDDTYANFYFQVPEEYREDLKNISEGNENFKPSEKWKKLFEAMDNDARSTEKEYMCKS